MIELILKFQTVDELKSFVDSWQGSLPQTTITRRVTTEETTKCTIPADMYRAKYTDYDDNVICEMYVLYPVRRIADQLGRSIQSVRNRIHFLHKMNRLTHRKRNPSIARLKSKVIRVDKMPPMTLDI